MIVEEITDGSLAEIPVFPLPATVLFPGTALPLHVFEPRYRAMIEDAMASDRAICIAMLGDDADPMAPQGAVQPVACAGRIVHDERLEDGRYNVLVHGLCRVRLVDELELKNGYRRFRAERIADPTASDIHAASGELARLQSCILSLRSSVEETDQQLLEVMNATADPLVLADILSAVLVHDPDRRQELLACQNLAVRLSRLIDAVTDMMVQVGEPTNDQLMN